MTVPDVSVIIPTRNRCRQLKLALVSALGQRDADLEVLVIDDGSTDATEEVVSRISDARLRYVKRGVPAGVSAARNCGIEESKGRWIAFLDDDDVWAPTKLVRQLEVMQAHGRPWSYAGDVVVDEELNILAGAPPPPPDEVMRLLERHNAVPAGASNVIVRTDVLRAVGPFDPHLSNNEDWDMWIRLARVGPPDWICSPLVAISTHRGNASRNMRKMIQELDVITRRYGIRVDHARHFRWAAWQSLLDGQRTEAARYYMRAVGVGDVPSVARAFVALVLPGYAIARTGSTHGASDPGPWIAEASGWLRALREI